MLPFAHERNSPKWKTARGCWRTTAFFDYRRVRTNQRAPRRAELFLASAAVPVIAGRSPAPLPPKAMYGSSASRRVNPTSIEDAVVHRPLLNRINTVVSCPHNTPETERNTPWSQPTKHRTIRAITLVYYGVPSIQHTLFVEWFFPISRSVVSNSVNRALIGMALIYDGRSRHS